MIFRALSRRRPLPVALPLTLLLLLAIGFIRLSLRMPLVVSGLHPSTLVISPLGIFPLLHALLPP